jgi:cobalt-zinc-cadmium resistance protein CzcA
LLKQYHVLIDPNRLINYGITIRHILDVLSANNRNSSGGFLVEGAEERLIRGLGRIETVEDIENIVVAERDGLPVFIRQIADVQIGPFVRRGAASENGEEIVAITVQNQYNANVMHTIQGAEAEVHRLQQTFGNDVRLSIFYTQLEMIERAISNVRNALYFGAALVVLILLVFLGNLRTTLVVTLTIPLSLVTAFIFMRAVGLTLNIMTMGGLAVGIGMMVDASIIMAENIFRHVQQDDTSRREAIRRGAQDVIRPIFFATLIFLASFAPVFTLHGLEGKMFVPLAVAVSTALLGSLVVSLSLTIVLCGFLLRGYETKQQETAVIRFFKKLYNPLLDFSLDHRALMLAIGALLFICALVAVFYVGTEFMPEIDESSLIMDILLPPGTSLGESTRVADSISREVSKFPEVLRVVNRTGRAEGAEHAEPVNLTEANVILVPKEERSTSIQEIQESIRALVGEVPGVSVSLNSPLQHRINHTLTGTKAAIAVKLFGDDLELLNRLAESVEEIVEATPGTADVRLEQTSGVPQLRVELAREKIARYGINVNDVSEVIEIALNGKVASQIIETQKRYDLFLRFKEPYRSNIQQIGNILIDTPSGARVPLSELASLEPTKGPPIIRKEGTLRRVLVQCNVKDRDLGSVVAELQQSVEELELPEGYFIIFGGTYENQIRAMRQLSIVVTVTILIVFILLYTTFNSLKQAFLIVFNVPHAMVGGILMLYLTGLHLSVPSIVGFLALAGICVQDGIVLINQIRLNREHGLPLRESLVKAGNTKMRPVLITTFTTILGIMPLILSSGTGSEIQRPLGLVLVAGILFSTFLTLVVLPTIYSVFEGKVEAS